MSGRVFIFQLVRGVIIFCIFIGLDQFLIYILVTFEFRGGIRCFWISLGFDFFLVVCRRFQWRERGIRRRYFINLGNVVFFSIFYRVVLQRVKDFESFFCESICLFVFRGIFGIGRVFVFWVDTSLSYQVIRCCIFCEYCMLYSGE